MKISDAIFRIPIHTITSNRDHLEISKFQGSLFFKNVHKCHSPFRMNPSPLPASLAWDDFSESLHSSWYRLQKAQNIFPLKHGPTILISLFNTRAKLLLHCKFIAAYTIGSHTIQLSEPLTDWLSEWMHEITMIFPNFSTCHSISSSCQQYKTDLAIVDYFL